MSYKTEKKNRKNNTRKISFAERIKQVLIKKKSILIFTITFCLFIVLFYVVWQSELFMNRIHPQIIRMNAFIASEALNLLGQNTTYFEGFIHSQNFSMGIAKGCDAFEAIALFLAATIAIPLTLRKKVVGIAIGIIVLMSVNLIRVVSLFLVRMYFIEAFEVLHVQIWPVFIIIISVVLLLRIIRYETTSENLIAK